MGGDWREGRRMRDGKGKKMREKRGNGRRMEKTEKGGGEGKGNVSRGSRPKTLMDCHWNQMVR